MNFITSHPVLTVFAALIFFFNSVVFWALLEDDGTTTHQKVFQSILIWVIPVIGGTVVLLILGSHHSRDEMASMVPYPFHFVGLNPQNTDKQSEFSSAECPPETTCGEGACGGE